MLYSIKFSAAGAALAAVQYEGHGYEDGAAMELPADEVFCTEEQHDNYLDYQCVDGGIVALPAEALVAAAKAKTMGRIAGRRYQAETAGITLDGKPIDTGRDSQALITGAAVAAMLDANYSCQWKTAEGFVELTGQQILAIATGMRAHVQACFDREAELITALEGGTFTDAMLDDGWPA